MQNSEIKDQINRGIRQGVEYLIANRNREGLWETFPSGHHGSATTWPTGYIGNILMKNKVITEDEGSEIANEVIKLQCNEGGYGFNDSVVTDADATSFVIRFLTHFAPNYNTSIEKALHFLLGHQDESGGFRTFGEYRVLRDPAWRSETVLGWTQPLSEISASALLAISACDRIGIVLENDDLQKRANFALNFIENSRRQNGGWNSYWWSCDTYASSICINALTTYQRRVDDCDLYSLESALQGTDLYYKSLALSALFQTHPSDDTLEVMSSSLQEIVRSQNDNGSWDGSASLQVPQLYCVAPWEKSDLRHGNYMDVNGVFTTATCINALANCRDFFGA